MSIATQIERLSEAKDNIQKVLAATTNINTNGTIDNWHLDILAQNNTQYDEYLMLDNRSDAGFDTGVIVDSDDYWFVFDGRFCKTNTSTSAQYNYMFGVRTIQNQIGVDGRFSSRFSFSSTNVFSATNQIDRYENIIPTQTYLLDTDEKEKLLNRRFKFIRTSKDFYIIYDDGTYRHELLPEGASYGVNTYSLFLGALSSQGTTSMPWGGAIYNFKIYKGDQLIKNYIPHTAYNSSRQKDEPCFLDTVNNDTIFSIGWNSDRQIVRYIPQHKFEYDIIGTGGYKVEWMDYRGNTLRIQKCKQGDTLIPPTTHIHYNDYVRFYEWNDNYHTTCPDHNLLIGATNFTCDLFTHIIIEVDDENYKNFTMNFRINKTRGIGIDWGDGSYTANDIDAATDRDIEFSHEYQNLGRYDIRIACQTNATGLLRDSVSNNYRNFVGEVNDSAATLKDTYARHTSLYVKEIYTGHLLGLYYDRTFYALYNLKYISPHYTFNLGTSRTNIFRSCSSLQALVLPIAYIHYTLPNFNETSKARLSFPCTSTARAWNYNMQFHGADCIIPPENTTTNSVSNMAYNIVSHVCYTFIPYNVSAITGSYNFIYYNWYGQSNTYFDFGQTRTTVPTLSQTSLTNNSCKYSKFIIPASLWNEWKNATNWSVLASYGNFYTRDENGYLVHLE